MSRAEGRFADWLNTTIRTRGMSQASFARRVGVADAQVSRWRRGQVTPTVRYLQRIADTLEVPRATLDQLAGYPVEDVDGQASGAASDPVEEAELQSYQAALRREMEETVPRPLWRAYVEACRALAGSLSASFSEALETASAGEQTEDGAAGGRASGAGRADHPIGFQPGRARGGPDRQ